MYTKMRKFFNDNYGMFRNEISRKEEIAIIEKAKNYYDENIEMANELEMEEKRFLSLCLEVSAIEVLKNV